MSEEGIGFIGFGEAGSTLAGALAAKATAEVTAFDKDGGNPALRARAETAGVTLVTTLEALCQASDLVFSTVVSSQALTVAEATAVHLDRRHTYLDLNSTSPAVQQATCHCIEATGANFIEAAVMAAVPPRGLGVPMLLCGTAVPEVIDRLAPLGFNLEDLGRQIGPASTTKMLRSVIVKGVEALLLECLLAAEPLGIGRPVLESVEQGYGGMDWNELADYLIARTAQHGARRGHELEEVAATLAELGVEPMLAEAASRRLLQAAEALGERFREAAPEDTSAVVTAIRDAT